MKILLLMLLPMLVFGQDGESHWVEKYPNIINDTVFTNFDGTDWVRSSGDTVKADTEFVQNGEQSIRVYSTTETRMAKQFVANYRDFSGYDWFVLKLHIDGINKKTMDSLSTNRIRIVFYSGAGTLVSETYLKYINSFDDWYTIPIHKSYFGVTSGTPKWDSITQMEFRTIITAPNRAYITFDQFSMGESPHTKGGVVFWWDVAQSSILDYGKPIFDRYGLKLTFCQRPQYLGEGRMTISEMLQLQYEGHDLVVYPWDYDALTTLTPVGVDTQITTVKNFMIDNAMWGNTILAFSQASHNRMVDSVVFAKGIEYGRGSSEIYKIGTSAISYAPIPTYSSKLSFPFYTYYTQSISELTAIVDSAISRNVVPIIVFHGISTTTDVSTSIDTTKLDSLLKYTKAKLDAGDLAYAGKFTNYLEYAPTYMIRNKSRAFDYGELEVIDSISMLADSMRIVLYDSTVTGWDSIAGTAMLVRGSICTLNVSGLSVGTHTLREWGVANSGHIDSGLAVYTLTNPAPVIDSIEPTVLYFKGDFLIATGKVAEWNGDTIAMSGETDSSFYLPVTPKGNNLPDTLKIWAGVISMEKIVKYDQKRTKLILGVK